MMVDHLAHVALVCLVVFAHVHKVRELHRELVCKIDRLTGKHCKH